MNPLVVDSLAVYRLARLVTKDQLTAGLRDAVIRGSYTRALTCPPAPEGHPGGPGLWAEIVDNDPDAPSLAYLVTCPWCAGFWLAAGVVLARRWFPRLWGPVAEALALSAVAGLVAERLDG